MTAHFGYETDDNGAAYCNTCGAHEDFFIPCSCPRKAKETDMPSETIDPILHPTDFLDAVIAESEARSPGFGARVAVALEERCHRRAEMNGPIVNDTTPIKAGDVVFLKSGSPPLTVETVVDEEGTCADIAWFDGAKLATYCIATTALTRNPTCDNSLKV